MIPDYKELYAEAFVYSDSISDRGSEPRI